MEEEISRRGVIRHHPVASERLSPILQYLTAAPWAAVLLLFFGWILHPSVSFLPILFVPAAALWTHRVHMGMRDEKMAEDLRQYGSQYSEIVFFAGDDHIDSVGALLGDEFEIVEEEESRP